MIQERTKVLSVVGPGRSGTTILASVMGEAKGVVSAGEMRWLWRRGLLEKRTCGCGRPPTECPVWSEVLTHVLSAHRPPRSETAAELAVAVDAAQREVAARRNRLRVIRSATTGNTTWGALQRVQSATEEVCIALATVTDAQLVIDTSKRAQDAAVVAAIEGVEHYVLHIVRDPRAVTYSWGRTKSNPSAERNGTMLTRGALGAVGRWTENCAGAEVLKRYVPRERWFSLRYEDFVAAPRRTIAAIFEFLDVAAEAPFVSDDTVVLGGNHTVAGNPNRFRTGPVTIAEDGEWRTKMARRDRMVVEAVALPLMLRYGYPMRAGRAG